MLCCFGLFSLKIVLVVQSSNWGDIASCSPIAPLLLMEYRDRKKIWTAPKNGAQGGKSDRTLKERENVCFLSSFYEAKSERIVVKIHVRDIEEIGEENRPTHTFICGFCGHP